MTINEKALTHAAEEYFAASFAMTPTNALRHFLSAYLSALGSKPVAWRCRWRLADGSASDWHACEDRAGQYSDIAGVPGFEEQPLYASPQPVPEGWNAATADVLAERRRQVEVEGWTPEHDDDHRHGELARAAACYARPDDVSYTDNFGRVLDDDGEARPLSPRELQRKWSYVSALRWPWSKRWWKPGARRRNLVKAGALIIAEIERIDRAMLAAAPEAPHE